MKKSYLIVVSIVVIVVVIAAITIHTNSNTRMSMSTSTQVSKDAVSTNQVNITNYAFSAAVIKVSTGTTVTWTNMDNVHHTVTVDSGTSSGPNSGELAIGQRGLRFLPSNRASLCHPTSFPSLPQRASCAPASTCRIFCW